MYKMFLDDERNPINKYEWIIVRDYDHAVNAVLNKGFPFHISFDHDLGLKETGYDFAKWLIDHDMNTGLMPSNFSFYVHSQNPIGKRNIEGLLQNYINHKLNK